MGKESEGKERKNKEKLWWRGEKRKKGREEKKARRKK